MKAFAKTMSIIIGLLDQAVGIAVAVIMILNRDYFAVIVLNGWGYYDTLLFNAAVFTAILAAIGFVLNLFLSADKKDDKPVDFPLVYEVLPVIVAGIGIYFAVQSAAGTERILTIVLSVLYAALSAVVILYATKIMKMFPKEK